MARNGGFTPEEKNKLTSLVNEGIKVQQEIEDLRVGLKDTVNAIAEEMDIKAGVLNKAIKTAYKCNWTEQNEDHSLVEDILDAVGKKV